MKWKRVCTVLLISGYALSGFATAGATSNFINSTHISKRLSLYAKSEKSLPRIGQAFLIGQFRVLVHSVRCGIKSVGSDGSSVTAHGQFCALKLTLVNISKRPATYSSDSDTAYDSAGQEFAFNDDDIDADTAGNNNPNGNSGMDGVTINPTYSLTGNLYLEVPIRVHLTKVHLYTAYFPPGKGQMVLLKT